MILPDGYTLDSDVTAPEGYTLDAPPSPSRTGSFLQGLRDPLDAAAQMVSHAVPSGVNETLDAWMKPLIDRGYLAPSNPQAIDAGIQAREAAYQAIRGPNAGTDWWRIGGNVAGTLPLMMGSAPETMVGAAVQGARLGSTGAALNPVTGPTDDFWRTKLGQAKEGAQAGALLGPVAKVAGGAISPQASNDVQYLVDRGVSPTLGQMSGRFGNYLEEKLSSLPIMGEIISGARGRAVQQFNTAAYNEALRPIGETLENVPGREAVTEVEKKLGDAYDRLLPNAQFQADPQFGTDLTKLYDLAQNLPPEQRARFTTVLQNKLLPRLGSQGTMDGLTFKGLDSELGTMARGYAGDASFDNRQLGGAIRETQSILRQTFERSNPDIAPDLAKVNTGWAVYTRLRDAASRLGAEDGVFTPAQLQSAVRAGDKSVGKGTFARGDALLQTLSDAGKKVLSNKVPDSGTAGRAALPFLAEKAFEGEIPFSALGIAGAGMLPYTSVGQRVTAALMSKRPDFMQPVTGPLSSVVRKGVPMVGAQQSILSGYPSLLSGSQ